MTIGVLQTDFSVISERLASRGRSMTMLIVPRRSTLFHCWWSFAEYDYILLDINKELYKTLLLSSLIVLIVDNSCMMSLWAAEHFL